LDHLFRYEVQTIIDVNLANFFNTIDHTLLTMLSDKIKDPRFLRYLARMFKAGVLAKGDLQVSDEAVPQGSPCSPVLANIFAHYVIDTWFEETVKPHCVVEWHSFATAMTWSSAVSTNGTPRVSTKRSGDGWRSITSAQRGENQAGAVLQAHASGQ
jgi:hypothetical protein